MYKLTKKHRNELYKSALEYYNARIKSHNQCGLCDALTHCNYNTSSYSKYIHIHYFYSDKEIKKLPEIVKYYDKVTGFWFGKEHYNYSHTKLRIKVLAEAIEATN